MFNNKKLSRKNTSNAIITTALLVLIIIGFAGEASAQFTFTGDYDRTFAAPNGYYTDPRDVDPTVVEYQTVLYTGELLADGSIISGGRLVSEDASGISGDFYLRKFTASGAIDTTFGTNGFLRTNFYAGGGTSKTNELVAVYFKGSAGRQNGFCRRMFESQSSRQQSNSRFRRRRLHRSLQSGRHARHDFRRLSAGCHGAGQYRFFDSN